MATSTVKFTGKLAKIAIKSPGPPGRTGDPGKDGQDGHDGSDGKDGISTRVEISFPFVLPEQVWHVIHNVGRYPTVKVLINGIEVFPSVKHFDVNVLEIGFFAPMSGTVYLS